MMILRLIGCLFLLSLAGAARADLLPIWQKANESYSKNLFEEAKESYLQLEEEGVVSANLYFNLGNTFYRLGQPGEAVGYYLKAKRLKARDHDIRANMNYLMAQTNPPSKGGAAAWADSIFFWNGALTFPEASQVLFILVTLTFAVGLVSLKKAGSVRMTFRLLLVITLVFAASLFWRYREEEKFPPAVVKDANVVGLASFLESSPPVVELKEGWVVNVLQKQGFGEKEGWSRVRLADGQSGWVKDEFLFFVK